MMVWCKHSFGEVNVFDLLSKARDSFHVDDALPSLLRFGLRREERMEPTAPEGDDHEGDEDPEEDKTYQGEDDSPVGSTRRITGNGAFASIIGWSPRRRRLLERANGPDSGRPSGGDYFVGVVAKYTVGC